MTFKRISDQQAIILTPTEKPQASMIWLHGLGADGHDFVDIVPQLKLPENMSMRFVFPHAPVRSVTLNNNMPMRAWFDLYGLDRLAKIDTQGIAETQARIEQLIQEEISLGISSEQIILAGFSQGGAMALVTGLNYATTLGGILWLSAYLPQISTPNAANKSTPIMIMHGVYDEIISVELGRQTYLSLKEQGYSAEWREYPMGHSVCPQEIQDISSWIQEIIDL